MEYLLLAAVGYQLLRIIRCIVDLAAGDDQKTIMCARGAVANYSWFGG